jgi:MoxR-like ATPase
MQQQALQVYVDPAVVEYAVRLVAATRDLESAGLAELDGYVSYGASPRASIALVAGGRALAFLRGRGYVLPHDLEEIALDVLRHRVVLSYEALADDVTADAVIARVLGAVTAPEVAMSGGPGGRPGTARSGNPGARSPGPAPPGNPGSRPAMREPRSR